MYYHRPSGWLMGQHMDDSYGEAITYDKNGNILTLDRTGELLDAQQALPVDNLTYTYNGNQLQAVTDATNSPAGFNDGNKIGADYTYDVFGNLKTDKNKGITNITYNHLNLPVEITFATGKITYTYDATGTKVKKVVQPNSGVAQTTDYLYGFQYLNGQLQFFPHAEGYVKPNGTNSYLYVYQYKDHLGNVRLSYADCDGDGLINPATEILEENNYYPFGLQHQGYNDIANSCRSEEAEAYKFNGKEYEDSFGLNIYEMDLRQLDPAIGRWLVQDPVINHEYSPYSAFDNNPVYWSDPSGADSQKNVTIADLFNNAKSGVTSFEFENGQLVGESFAENIEATLEESYSFLEAPTEGGGGGNGNGGSGKGKGSGDQQPKNYKNLWIAFLSEIGGGSQVLETHFEALELSTRSDGSVNWAGYSGYTLWKDKINNFGGDMGSASTFRTYNNFLKNSKVIWNLGESVITKKHHNWNKLFINRTYTLNDVGSYVKTAVKKGNWQSAGEIAGKKGVAVGDKFYLEANVNGHTIWVIGFRQYSTGNFFINNAGIK